MNTQKGFITLATGNEQFYKMAHNLLLSYRYHTKSKTPFAILCDRRNEWTAEFDDVIVIDYPTYSYVDKMRILDLSPYDETIFIDADCLIYRDLTPLWDIFKEGPDVGVLGVTYPLSSNLGWWDIKDLGELKEKVSYKMTCQGGMYYVRKKGSMLPSFIETCYFIQEHYFDYHFRMCGDKVADENILSLASCVHHYLPVKNWVDVFAYYPYVRFVDVDILSGTLVFDGLEYPGKLFKDSFMIHFGTANALNRWEYKREVFKLKKGRLSLRNYGELFLLRLSHAGKKVILTIRNRINHKG